MIYRVYIWQSDLYTYTIYYNLCLIISIIGLMLNSIPGSWHNTTRYGIQHQYHVYPIIFIYYIILYYHITVIIILSYYCYITILVIYYSCKSTGKNVNIITIFIFIIYGLPSPTHCTTSPCHSFCLSTFLYLPPLSSFHPFIVYNHNLLTSIINYYLILLCILYLTYLYLQLYLPNLGFIYTLFGANNY